MKVSRRRLLLVPVMALAAAMGIAGSIVPAGAQTVIKIGIDLPVSGADAASGVPTQNGAMLAIEQANKTAPKGIVFAAVALDDAVGGKHNPQQGANNLKSLVADPQVLGVVGPFNSNVATAEIPISNLAGLVQVSPSNTNPDLTKTAKFRTAHPNVINYFRVCTTDLIQGRAGATFARQQGFKKAYILDDNETYGKGLADVFEKDFKAMGGTVLGHEHITADQQDFKSLLSKVAATNPDVLYWGGVFSTGGGLIRQQMAAAGMDPAKVAFFSGDDFPSNPAYLKLAGAAAANTFATLPAPDVSRIPAAKKFVADYTARFKSDVGGYSPGAYVSAQVIINGIRTAMKQNGGKVPTRAAVIKAVHAEKVKSIIGNFAFDKNGDTTNPLISLWTVKNGKWEFSKQINVATK